jgi:hypothetical protein
VVPGGESVTDLLVQGETPARVMAMLAQAREDLQRIEDPREAASFVKQTEGIRYLAEKASASHDLQNQAAEVAIRAKRRAGELLAADPDLGQGGDRRSKDSVSLDSYGIQPHDSKRWQAVASVLANPNFRQAGVICYWPRPREWVAASGFGEEITVTDAGRLRCYGEEFDPRTFMALSGEEAFDLLTSAAIRAELGDPEELEP